MCGIFSGASSVVLQEWDLGVSIGELSFFYFNILLKYS